MIYAYLVDDITIKRSGGYDSWQEPLASTNLATKGKVEYKTKLVKNLQGEDVISNALVYLHGSKTEKLLDRELTHEDRLIFAVEHVIIRIDKPKAFSSPHYEVYVT